MFGFNQFIQKEVVRLIGGKYIYEPTQTNSFCRPLNHNDTGIYSYKPKAPPDSESQIYFFFFQHIAFVFLMCFEKLLRWMISSSLLLIESLKCIIFIFQPKSGLSVWEVSSQVVRILLVLKICQIIQNIICNTSAGLVRFIQAYFAERKSLFIYSFL